MLSTFQVPNSHMWLRAAVLEGDISSILDGSIGQRYCAMPWVQMWHEDPSAMWSQPLSGSLFPCLKTKGWVTGSGETRVVMPTKSRNHH